MENWLISGLHGSHSFCGFAKILVHFIETAVAFSRAHIVKSVCGLSLSTHRSSASTIGWLPHHYSQLLPRLHICQCNGNDLWFICVLCVVYGCSHLAAIYVGRREQISSKSSLTIVPTIYVVQPPCPSLRKPENCRWSIAGHCISTVGQSHPSFGKNEIKQSGKLIKGDCKAVCYSEGP